jgi:hypothetical protein
LFAITKLICFALNCQIKSKLIQIIGEFGEIIPAVVGGGSTTYWCDYSYTNIPASGVALRGVVFGGGAGNGASAGFGYALSTYAPSYSNETIGSRLCFLP